MSCYFASKGNIDAIVQYAFVSGLVKDPTAVGRMLWGANALSFETNYGHNIGEPEWDKEFASNRRRASRYVFKGIEAPLHFGKVLQAARCVSYQCDEAIGFYDSPAGALLTLIKQSLSSEPPVGHHHKFKNSFGKMISVESWDFPNLKAFVA